jgi:cyclophilin family peptidyl-prolyl cis-trans isomerase
MTSECPPADGSALKTVRFAGPPPMCIDPAKRYTATMVTSKGTLVFALDAARAPQTVNSFVFLARYHFFDGIAFHRIIPGFVVQGGDPTGTGTGGPGYRFADELPQPGRYEIGSLAMANAGPDTNGSQFFIISGAQGTALPPLYSLFGQAVAGLDVLAAIEATGSPSGKPTARVVIESVTIAEADD